jgi:hypothetical protein
MDFGGKIMVLESKPVLRTFDELSSLGRFNPALFDAEVMPGYFESTGGLNLEVFRETDGKHFVIWETQSRNSVAWFVVDVEGAIDLRVLNGQSQFDDDSFRGLASMTHEIISTGHLQ